MEAMGPNIKIALGEINVEDVKEAKLMATVFWHLGTSSHCTSLHSFSFLAQLSINISNNIPIVWVCVAQHHLITSYCKLGSSQTLGGGFFLHL